jgi:hypothetical protein
MGTGAAAALGIGGGLLGGFVLGQAFDGGDYVGAYNDPGMGMDFGADVGYGEMCLYQHSHNYLSAYLHVHVGKCESAPKSRNGN